MLASYYNFSIYASAPFYIFLFFCSSCFRCSKSWCLYILNVLSYSRRVAFDFFYIFGAYGDGISDYYVEVFFSDFLSFIFYFCLFRYYSKSFSSIFSRNISVTFLAFAFIRYWPISVNYSSVNFILGNSSTLFSYNYFPGLLTLVALRKYCKVVVNCLIKINHDWILIKSHILKLLKL